MECLLDLLCAQSVLTLQPHKRSRIDAAATTAHHQPLQRGQSHGRVHAAAVAHGAGRAATAQVDDDDLEGVGWAVQHVGSARQGPGVGETVKAVAAQPVLNAPLLRDCVLIGGGRQLRVEGGVETGDVGNVGQ